MNFKVNDIQFPGVNKCIDEFTEKENYKRMDYYGDDGVKNRGYIFFEKQ